MMVGPVAAGKTSLIQRLNDETLEYQKTQSVHLRGAAIDTPGEYIQNKKLLYALTVTSVDADIVLLIQDATAEVMWYSPAQAEMFQAPTVGVVTKTDLATEKQIAWARETLEQAGTKSVFLVSNMTKAGIAELKAHLESMKIH